jgi:2-C-methyl-D-erythritol 2,4-cyclodiphosphate synthase
MHRVGIGYDIHRLVKGRKLILGGITVPYSKGLLGHSDADVLLHALCDALLGAINAGDIGEHFPDSDPRYKNIASGLLLKETASLLKRKGFSVGNIDIAVIAEKPKLALYKSAIRKNISQILKIAQEKISVKAKTNEGLDATGKGNAIGCFAVVVVKK